MEGDDRVRVCAKCEKRVYNLAALSHEEISDLLIETEGAICARLFRRSGGTILTADCPVGRASRIRRFAVSALVAALFLLGAFVMALGASTGPRTRANPTGFASWLQGLAKRMDSAKRPSKRTAGHRQQYVGVKGGLYFSRDAEP